MRWPQLWSEDALGAVKWIKEVLAQQAREQNLEGEEPVVSSESTGMARVWLAPTIPSGWIKLDGSFVFITEAPDLYALLGSAGAAPANMFRLPDAPSALASGTWIIKR